MKIYRLKHIPSGLYFIPSREIKIKVSDGNQYQQNGIYVKSNLPKTGKTYIKKPSFAFIGKMFYTHDVKSATELNRYGDKLLPFIETEWKIEEND